MDQIGYIKLNAVLNRIPDLFDKIEQMTGGWFHSLFASLIGAVVGATLGYYLLSRREDKKECRRFAIKIYDKLNKFQLETIVDTNLISNIVSNIPQAGQAEKSDIKEYIDTVYKLHSITGSIILLYIEIREYIPKYSKLAEHLKDEWFVLLKSFPDDRNLGIIQVEERLLVENNVKTFRSLFLKLKGGVYKSVFNSPPPS